MASPVADQIYQLGTVLTAIHDAVRRFIPFVNDWCDLSTIPDGMDKTKCPSWQDPKAAGTKTKPE
eukprot:COSAG02_NODE_2580_length_8493_cov_3.138432_3_plen_65_part_00